MKLFTRTLAAVLIIFVSFLPAAAETAVRRYLVPGSVNLTNLLAPAPPDDSLTTAQEIKTLLFYQTNRTPEMVKYARADEDISVFRFADVLGTNFTAKNLPVASAFFNRAVSTGLSTVDQLKNYWKRPRPYEHDRSVKPCLEKPLNASYPSGHSAGGSIIAILLANMVPEKRTLIFDRGWAFAMNRVIGGVHYPSDIEAGRIAAALIVQEMFKNPDFLKDYEAAKKEVRKVLELP